MLDLAISIDIDQRNTAIIETNQGVRLKAPDWPNDCDFQLVAFDPSGETCEIVPAEALAGDIGKALMSLNGAEALEGEKPDWYRRLELYAARGPKA
jgi:hypothetical protein